jgi:hypothetical protein
MAQVTTVTDSTGKATPAIREIISADTVLGNRVLRYGLVLVIG